MASPAETAYEEAASSQRPIKEMVLEHLGLVRRVVDRIGIDLNQVVSKEDLTSAGTVGLVEAAHRFDPARGVQFATFAYWRVRGAVIDCLRDNDRLGKSARAQLEELRGHILRFRQAHGRKPAIAELAELCDLSEGAVLECMAYEKWDCVGSLDGTATDDQGRVNALAELVRADVRTPPEELERKERVEQLARAIEALPERQKQVIVMYYYEDLYMSEMAEVLEVSESRVSQLHTLALYNLTRQLEGQR